MELYRFSEHTKAMLDLYTTEHRIEILTFIHEVQVSNM